MLFRNCQGQKTLRAYLTYRLRSDTLPVVLIMQVAALRRIMKVSRCESGKGGQDKGVGFPFPPLSFNTTFPERKSMKIPNSSFHLVCDDNLCHRRRAQSAVAASQLSGGNGTHFCGVMIVSRTNGFRTNSPVVAMPELLRQLGCSNPIRCGWFTSFPMTAHPCQT